MTPETEKWLEPMVEALLADRLRIAALGGLIDTVTSPDSSPGVDWLLLGQLMRMELGWDHYPESPIIDLRDAPSGPDQR